MNFGAIYGIMAGLTAIAFWCYHAYQHASTDNYLSDDDFAYVIFVPLIVGAVWFIAIPVAIAHKLGERAKLRRASVWKRS